MEEQTVETTLQAETQVVEAVAQPASSLRYRCGVCRRVLPISWLKVYKKFGERRPRSVEELHIVCFRRHKHDESNGCVNDLLPHVDEIGIAKYLFLSEGLQIVADEKERIARAKAEQEALVAKYVSSATSRAPLKVAMGEAGNSRDPEADALSKAEHEKARCASEAMRQQAWSDARLVGAGEGFPTNGKRPNRKHGGRKGGERGQQLAHALADEE